MGKDFSALALECDLWTVTNSNATAYKSHFNARAEILVRLLKCNVDAVFINVLSSSLYILKPHKESFNPLEAGTVSRNIKVIFTV